MANNAVSCLGFFFLLFAMTIPSSAATKDTIIWYTLDFPPAFIREGEHRGEGFNDKTMAIIQEKLPGYNHTTVPVNTARLWRTLELGDLNVCNLGAIETPEREKFVYHSIHTGFVPAHSIVLLKDNAHNFENHENISLEAILKNKNLKGRFNKGRSYGAVIDDIIRRNEGTGNLKAHSVLGMSESLVLMLLRNRVDFLIEYPWVAMFLERELDVSGELLSIPIQETQPYILGTVVCPKNEWGHKVIRDINRVIREERRTERWIQTVADWLDENSRKHFIKYYQGSFLENND